MKKVQQKNITLRNLKRNIPKIKRSVCEVLEAELALRNEIYSSRIWKRTLFYATELRDTIKQSRKTKALGQKEC